MLNLNIILASSSIYRQELLGRLQVPFFSESPRVDEEFFKQKLNNPEKLAEKLASEKANEVASRKEHCLIIGSDQVAAVDGEILGKPHSIEGACEQLKKLRGKTHTLYTAVHFVLGERQEGFIDKTNLKMRNLSDKQIRFYVERDRPLDCAGSYKVESLGIALFEEIHCRDQTAIMGLPLIQTALTLERFGVRVLSS